MLVFLVFLQVIMFCLHMILFKSVCNCFAFFPIDIIERCDFHIDFKTHFTVWMLTLKYAIFFKNENINCKGYAARLLLVASTSGFRLTIQFIPSIRRHVNTCPRIPAYNKARATHNRYASFTNGKGSVMRAGSCCNFVWKKGQLSKCL